jgi:GTP cyclohydrolase I
MVQKKCRHFPDHGKSIKKGLDMSFEAIKKRLKDAGVPHMANDNISDHLQDGDIEVIQAEVQKHMQGVLDALLIDTAADHNTEETAKRVAKMYVREVFAGRYDKAPKITDFPNAKELDQVYTLGPISIRSACSHHLVPITGKLWIGILPSDRVIGISKFVRLANWIMSRPHIQEEAAIMLADELEKRIKPKGLALVMDAQHQCMIWRGVKETNTTMTTSIMRGVFRDKPEARAEFMKLIEATR